MGEEQQNVMMHELGRGAAVNKRNEKVSGEELQEALIPSSVG
jgi:hypothetical protein